MSPKHHHLPLSGGDRKAYRKALNRSRAMATILARAAEEKRAAGEALIREADKLACEAWNEKMWCDGGPAQPSPTIAQAINGGYPWLEVKCSRCHQPRSVDLRTIQRRPETPIWKLEGKAICYACEKRRWAGRGVLDQLAQQPRHAPPD